MESLVSSNKNYIENGNIYCLLMHLKKHSAFVAFPNVIGALDCTHVRIKRPSGPHEADFVNRKSLHSINVQVQSH